MRAIILMLCVCFEWSFTWSYVSPSKPLEFQLEETDTIPVALEYEEEWTPPEIEFPTVDPAAEEPISQPMSSLRQSTHSTATMTGHGSSGSATGYGSSGTMSGSHSIRQRSSRTGPFRRWFQGRSRSMQKTRSVNMDHSSHQMNSSFCAT